MIPWTLLDTAKPPGGNDELRLMQRGTEFSIRVGRTELMNSRVGGSETALATMSCQRIKGRPQPRMLIGGLGMGFTLRAALTDLGADARIDLAEIVPSVVAWARGPMAAIFGNSLDDPRLTIHEQDVGRLIGATPARYDAILLDVDNGPDGLTLGANDSLYGMKGLATAKTALRLGGVLAIWSCAPDDRFVQRLERTGFAVSEAVVRANGARGARHVIWFATKPA